MKFQNLSVKRLFGRVALGFVSSRFQYADYFGE